MLKTIAQQKETVFLTKPSWGVESNFFQQAEAFMPIVLFFSPNFIKFFSNFEKNFQTVYFFDEKNTPHEKDSHSIDT